MAVHPDEYKVNKRLKRFPKIEELLDYDKESNTYEVIWNDRNIQAITNIVITVVKKHFMNPNLYDEYVSHALTKVVDVLISGEFDYENYGTTSGLKNFLYTCSRNALTDYSYHFVNSNKEVFYEVQPESTDYDKPPATLTDCDIDVFLANYFKRFHLVPQTFDKSEFVYLVKAMGYDCNLKATKPLPQNDDALERCLSQFSKWYFKNKL